MIDGGFLSKLRSPGYSYGPVGRLRRPPEEEEDRPASFIEYGTNPFRPAGALGQLGQQQRNEGPSGIHNTTGFAQTAPNVVYDMGPEQFAQEMKLKNRQLDIQKMQAEGILENNRALNDTRRQNADAATERAAIARFRAQNPNLVLRPIPGGNVIAFDPQSGEVMDTGISSGKMAEEDSINLKQEGAINRIGAQGRNEQTLENLRQTGRIILQDDAQSHDRAKTEFTAGAKTYQNKPTVSVPGMVAEAMKFYIQNPEYQKYFEWSDDGKSFNLKNPKSTKPGGYFTNETLDPDRPTEDQWRQMNQAIFGEKKTTGLPPWVEQGASGLPTNVDTTVMMVFPDGKRKKVKVEEVEKWTNLGGKRVQ